MGPLLDRFCTGGGRFNYWHCKWGLKPGQLCDFRADIQTMEHMINEQFSLHFFSGEISLSSQDYRGRTLIGFVSWVASMKISITFLFNIGTAKVLS